MKNMIQKGARMDFTNGTGSDIAAGDPVPVGNQIGVACGDIPNGQSGVLAMEDVFELPKTPGNAINQGTAPTFDASAGTFVYQGVATAAGDITGACTCWETADSAATTVKVKINTAIGAVAS